MKYQKLLNTNIKLLRQHLNMTQEEFAEKIGISIQGLSNIERNRYQPTADTIDRICTAFDITPIQLLLIQTNTNQDIIQNVIALLNTCSQKKLRKIYKIVYILAS